MGQNPTAKLKVKTQDPEPHIDIEAWFYDA